MITVPGADGLRHLVVRAPAGATVEEVAHRIGLGTAGGSPATVGGTLAPEALLHGQSLGHPPCVPQREAGTTALASVMVVSGPDAGRSVDLPPGRWLTVGRDPGCDLVVDDPSLSRTHLRVRHERDRFLVQDLGSTNGVHPAEVDRDRSPAEGPSPWAPGTTLLVGATRLRLISGTAAPLVGRTLDGRVRLEPWPRQIPHWSPIELTTPPPPARREVRAPSAWSWSLPLVIGLAVALVLRMPWLLLFGLLGPAMVLGQYLGDRRSARLEHEEALEEHRQALAELATRTEGSLRSELRVRRERSPGLVGVRTALAPGPTVQLWSRGQEPLSVVVGDGTVTSAVTVDGGARPLEHAPVTLDLSGPLVVVGPAGLRDAAVRSWVLQLATGHPPRSLAVLVDTQDPPGPGWDLLAWLPHTCSHPAPGTTHVLRWGRDLVLVDDLLDAPPGLPRLVVTSADRAVLQRPGEPDVELTPTLLSLPVARRYARRLAPLDDGTRHGPRRSTAATLGDLLTWPADVAAARRAWDGDEVDLTLPIGTAPDGSPVEIDLARDGPHALVAGTTGSGKSELLRTLVIALALRNGPDRVNVLLIDYKGGSSLGECDRLPHSVGLVTDLDPHLAGRVLESLQAELRRRESVLARSGARDVRDHPGTDLPRLVVVIDEFRVLREELPEFLDGLIRVAAVGRSLGLHLVLATQRPAGVVTADLRANVNLRIALRVRDETDSRDVIEVPDAARLPEGRPGAGLLSTGSSGVLPVQVAPALPASAPGTTWEVHEVADVWSGLRLLEDPPDPGPCEGGSVDELATVLRGAAVETGMRSRPVWLPPLPDDLATGEELSPHGHLPPHGDLPSRDGPVVDAAVWAVADRPDQQTREPVRWPARGHVGLVGAPRSGRSTALGALVRSAAEAWLYVLDLGRGLEGTRLADHAGLRAWVGPDEAAHGLRVLEVLGELVDARSAAPEPDAAPVLLVVDGWDRWVEQHSDVDGGRGVDLLLRLLREGPAAGVRCLVSGDRSLLLGRVAATLDQTWSLRLNDPSELTLSGVGRDRIPVDPPPGRVLRLPDGLLAQVVRDGPATPPGRRPPGTAPQEVLALPRTVTLADGWAVGGDGATELPVPEGSVLVLGPPRSGVTSTLRRLADGARSDGDVVVVDGPGSWSDADLRQALERGPATVVVDDAHLLAGTGTEDLLLDWARRGCGRLVVGAELASASGQFRGLVPSVAARRTGVVLQAAAPRDGLLLGATLPVGEPRVPGRGVLVDRGRVTRLQVAAPPGPGG